MRGVDRLLRNGERVKMGEQEFEVIHVPDHSSDSICLYSHEEKTLFSGDTPLQIRSESESHSRAFHEFLQRIVNVQLRCIYPGHGEPMVANVQKMLEESLSIVQLRPPSP
jgi:glyoxylase-like metal-dependent hydrolase (beta-lactamase superfamily II)